jgi:hypothetical protein
MNGGLVCVFCERGRAAVGHLVIGPTYAAACYDCIAEAYAALHVSRPIRRARHVPPPLAARHAFTDDLCRECGSLRMVRTRTCATCQDCGASGGCG